MRTCYQSSVLLGTVAFVLFSLVLVASAEEFIIPPVPDKNAVLPANDGEVDGCNSSRFACVMGGDAVLDKQTGLVWARNTEILRKAVPCEEAKRFCEDVEVGGKKGWRLPTREELISLLDTSQSRPALPEGHPFTQLRSFHYSGLGDVNYWTSTDFQGDSNSAWMVDLSVGRVIDSIKVFDGYAWPVRDGE
ncbi:MAG: DUF1566 domain-containing protein [Desulfofustis sp.]|jgi:hypothetical protein|nr:DUF1566 domain-containing protein [Desulfofustis sp.]